MLASVMPKFTFVYIARQETRSTLYHTIVQGASFLAPAGSGQKKNGRRALFVKHRLPLNSELI
jgi:hypothetical protein